MQINKSFSGSIIFKVMYQHKKQFKTALYIYLFYPIPIFRFILTCALRIQGEFQNKFPGFSGIGFCKKLARMKTQQSTEKSSKHSSCTVFFGLCSFSRISRSGVNFFYHLYSTSFTYSLFAPTPLFVSASAIECCSHSVSRVSSAGC